MPGALQRAGTIGGARELFQHNRNSQACRPWLAFAQVQLSQRCAMMRKGRAMRSSPGIRQPLTLRSEGFRATTYLSADGLIVRVPKNAIAMAMQRHLHPVLEALAPRINALPIPSSSCPIPPSDDFPFGALCYRAITGRPLQPGDITARNRAPIARQIAAFLAELHAVDPAIFGDIELSRFPAPPEEMRRIWLRCEPYLRDRLPPAQFAPIAAWYGDLIARLSAKPPATGLIHGDFWHENLIFDGTALAGVIDFEFVGIGVPVADFMTLGSAGADLRAATVREYRAIRPDFAYDVTLARRLLGLRELAGLAYGLETGDVDADQLAKIVAAARAHGA